MTDMSSYLATIAIVIASATSTFAADIVIAEPNWPSGSATAHIMKIVVENNLGYKVELQNGTNPVFFEGMDRGSIDAIPELNLPNQQHLYDTYVTEKGTVAVDPNVVPMFQGMCVPKYVADELGVKSIVDLTDPDKAALFDSDGGGQGEIWIGAPGWASIPIEKIRAHSYGYDKTMKLTEIDETLAYAKLDAALKAHKPWVGFCYSPHYAMRLYDLVALKEPAYDASKWHIVQAKDDPNWLETSSAPTGWAPTTIQVAYRKALDTEKPDVAHLFHSIALTSDEVSEMAYAIAVDKEDPDAFAKKWVADHKDKVLGWLTK